MELDLSVRRLPTASVIAVVGEVDVYTAPELDALLSAEVEAGQVHLVLDFTQVEFLDSTGLGVVIKALASCRESSGSVSVVVATERIRRVFEITGLDRSIRLGATLAEVAPAQILDPVASAEPGDQSVDG